MADEIKVDAGTTPMPPEDGKSNDAGKKPEEIIDYQVLYQEEKGRREKAEAVIQKHKKKDDEPIEPIYSPDIVEEIDRRMEERLAAFSSNFRVNEVQQAIQRRTTDPHETELVRYHFENSIRQTGDVELDVENAYVLANKQRVKSQLEELKASLVSKDTKSSGSPAGRKPAEHDEVPLPPLSEVDRQTIAILREKYEMSNDAIRRIINGERLDDLLQAGIVKKR